MAGKEAKGKLVKELKRRGSVDLGRERAQGSRCLDRYKEADDLDRYKRGMESDERGN